MTHGQWLKALENKQLWTAFFGFLGIVIDSTPLRTHVPAAALPAFEGVIIALLAAFGYQAGAHASAMQEPTTAQAGTVEKNG